MEPLDPPTPAGRAESPAPAPPPPPGTAPAGAPATDVPVVAIPAQPVEAVAITAETDYGRIFACEFVGTAVLVLCGPGSAILAGEAIGVWGIALAFGFALLVMAYVVGPTTGCNINPAVTLGMLLTRKLTLRECVYYWVAQLLGGIFGAAIVYGIASGRDGFERGNFASNGFDRESFSGLGAVIIVEIVFTALLVYVVLATTTRRFPPGFGGLVAGLTLALIHLVTIPVDNTSVNPARSIATAIFADTSPSALGQIWVFIIFPLIGAVLGVFVWLLTDPASLEDTMFDAEILRTARDKLDDVIE
jgi:aquaporin Z